METIKSFKGNIDNKTVQDSIINNYPKYIENLVDRNYMKESITIHENLSSIVTVTNLKSKNEGIVIDILCPPGIIISILGIKSYPEDYNIENIYPFELKLANTEGNDIGPETKIKIIKHKILRGSVDICDISYKDISMNNYSDSPNMFKTYSELYRFEHGIELKGEDHLKICVIHPDIDIDIIKFNIRIDLWTQTDDEIDLWTQTYDEIAKKQSLMLDYAQYLTNLGYSRSQFTINERSEIVNVGSIAKRTVGTVIDIRCPSAYKIVIAGRTQLLDYIHTVALKLTDSDGKEIAPDTRVKISKEKVSRGVTVIGTMFYKDISVTEYVKNPPNKTKLYEKCYRFNNNIELSGEEHLKIDIINPDIAIDAKNVQFSLDIDLWEN